jgi:hypothetical protein
MSAFGGKADIAATPRSSAIIGPLAQSLSVVCSILRARRPKRRSRSLSAARKVRILSPPSLGSQYDRKRGHSTFIAERRNYRYVPVLRNGTSALARGLSCSVCDVRATLGAGVRELGRAKSRTRTRRHDQYVRVPSITSLSATYSLHSVPQIRRTCSRSSLALRRLPCSACHMP